MQRETIVILETGNISDLHESENGAHETRAFCSCGNVPHVLQGANGKFADPRQKLFKILVFARCGVGAVGSAAGIVTVGRIIPESFEKSDLKPVSVHEKNL